MNPSRKLNADHAGENRLLLFTAVDGVRNAHTDAAIAAALRAAADWDYVLQNLVGHGTLLSFRRQLARLGLENGVPAPCREQLAHTELLLRHRNSRFFDEMKRLSSLFRSRGIPVVFIKGALLVISGYYDQESRLMEDIDCLVEPACLGRAARLLESAGYEQPDPERGAAHLRYKSELQFINTLDRELVVELSTKLNKSGELAACYPFRDEDFRAGLTPRTVDGAEFLVVEKEYHLAYCLFHHVALHYLCRLNWLNDLQLMLADPGLDARKLEGYLEAFGLRTARQVVGRIMAHHFREGPAASAGKLPAGLESLFCDDACRFVNPGHSEAHSVRTRLLLIGSVWKRLGVVLRKVILPPGWLRVWYGLAPETSWARVYATHYAVSLNRFFRRRSRRP